MGYDLNFWKYKKDVYLDNQDTYIKCSEEELVDGLEDLPIETIIKDIQQNLPIGKLKEVISILKIQMVKELLEYLLQNNSLGLIVTVWKVKI